MMEDSGGIMDNSSALSQKLDQSVEDLDYEQAFQQLEEIVAVLETGDYSLEVSIRLFERGQLLARHCAGLLDQAELKVQQLTGETLVDFSAEA
jgi:exodeoxyribonuclease VII small subunit